MSNGELKGALLAVANHLQKEGGRRILDPAVALKILAEHRREHGESSVRLRHPSYCHESQHQPAHPQKHGAESLVALA